jgi:hypothetical protein
MISTRVPDTAQGPAPGRRTAARACPGTGTPPDREVLEGPAVRATVPAVRATPAARAAPAAPARRVATAATAPVRQRATGRSSPAGPAPAVPDQDDPAAPATVRDRVTDPKDSLGKDSLGKGTRCRGRRRRRTVLVPQATAPAALAAPATVRVLPAPRVTRVTPGPARATALILAATVPRDRVMVRSPATARGPVTGRPPAPVPAPATRVLPVQGRGKGPDRVTSPEADRGSSTRRIPGIRGPGAKGRGIMGRGSAGARMPGALTTGSPPGPEPMPSTAGTAVVPTLGRRGRRPGRSGCSCRSLACPGPADRSRGRSRPGLRSRMLLRT